jgi:hypothetical protein
MNEPFMIHHLLPVFSAAYRWPQVATSGGDEDKYGSFRRHMTVHRPVPDRSSVRKDWTGHESTSQSLRLPKKSLQKKANSSIRAIGQDQVLLFVTEESIH